MIDSDTQYRLRKLLIIRYFQDKREKYMSDFFTTFVDLDWLYSVEFVSNTINEKLKWPKKWIRSEPDGQVLI